MLFPERKVSSRSSSSSAVSRRESLFDLLFLLRRGSAKQKSHVDEHPKSLDIFESELEEEDKCHLTREQLMEKIREKKAVIENLRCQPWPMQRKLRTLRLAQRYLQRQEARVSRTHLLRESIQRRWKAVCRWFTNFSIYLIPWEAKIKKIESHFGSVVSSYFIFLRWIFGINLIISLIMTIFITLPECIADAASDEYRKNRTAGHKQLTEKELETADYLQTIWDFKGYLARSPLFYGYYSNEEYVQVVFKYRLPLAYFLVNLIVLGYSFFAILRKMASNARTSKLSSGKTEQYVFSWKVTTGWDYTIGNPETAGNAIMATVTKFREAIMEHKEKQAEKFRWVRFFLRIVANLIILSMMACSTYAIYTVVERSRDIEHDSTATALQKIEVPMVVSFITLVFPNLFEMVSKLERFHPRTALRLQLARILVLYFLNFYTLIFAIFTKMEYLIKVQDSLQQLQFDLTVTNASEMPPQGTAGDNAALFRLVREAFQQLDGEVGAETLNASAVATATPIPLFHLIPKEFFTNRFLPYAKSIWQRRLVEAKTKAAARKPLPRRPSVTTPPPGLTWTTVHPEYGLLGVDNLHAFLVNGTVYKDLEELETFLKQNNLTFHITFGGAEVNRSQKGPSPGGTIFLIPQKLSSVELESLCWETMIGEEIAKLVTMDLVMNIASILTVDFLRGLWVRFCTSWWCWNLETVFPEYGEFKVAENVLHVINNQGMIWLGMFFCPLLPAMNNAKLVILLYTRAWAVMTCNIPAAEVFRASKSSNFYYILLLLIMFICVLPVGYVIASKEPSSTCGPFAGKDNFYTIISDQLKALLPAEVYTKMNVLSSPGIVIPVLILFILVIYFLISLVRGLKEANDDLNKQLFQERTEEKRKIFKMAGTVLDRKRNKEDQGNQMKKGLLQKKDSRRHSLKRFLSIGRDSEEEGTDRANKGRPMMQQGTWMNPLHARERESSQSFYVPSLKSLPEESEQEDSTGTVLFGRSKSDSHLKVEIAQGMKYAKKRYPTMKNRQPSLTDESDDEGEEEIRCKQPGMVLPVKAWTVNEEAEKLLDHKKHEQPSVKHVPYREETKRKLHKQPSLEMVEFTQKPTATRRHTESDAFKDHEESALLLKEEQDTMHEEGLKRKKGTKKQQTISSESSTLTEEDDTSTSAASEATPVIQPWPSVQAVERTTKLKPILKHPETAQKPAHRHKPRLIISVTPSTTPTTVMPGVSAVATKRYIIRQHPGPKYVEPQSSADLEDESAPSSKSDNGSGNNNNEKAGRRRHSSESSDDSTTIVEDRSVKSHKSSEGNFKGVKWPEGDPAKKEFAVPAPPAQRHKQPRRSKSPS
uniref:TMC domain-containing protein n=1 Tax=Trichuris muris TaxID=70415 RepID=A0A5S6R3R0_TRIMR